MKRKQIATCCLLTCLLACPALASYTYEVYTYGPSRILGGSESILVANEGGMYSLDLDNNSSATILGTSTLGQFSGGIWQIDMGGSSYLNFSGGELSILDLHLNATATLSGGRIDSIESTQVAWEWDYGVDPPEWVPNPHINLIYSGDLPTVDVSNVLTGLWGNGSAFSIELHDVSGYSPIIENIQFELIPEPATLILLGLGGLLIRRKK